MKRKRLDKEERKKQIKKVAIKLMMEQGYRNTGVKEIVDAANYSAGGFYNCYSSKEELFREIVEDGMKYNNQKILEYKNKYKELSRKDFIIEALLGKIFDDNDYKRVSYIFLIEMVSNQDLFEVYKTLTDNSIESFIDFCKSEDLDEYISLINEDFMTLIFSLILGVEMFNKSNDLKYKEIVKVVLETYFEEINLFNDVSNKVTIWGFNGVEK